jgi:hypothetical protein
MVEITSLLKMHGVIPAFWFPALAAIVLLLFMIPYIQHAYAHFVGQTFVYVTE